MGTIVAWPEGTTAADRVAAGGLAVVIVVGSAVLWVGVPVGGIWLAGRVTANGIDALLLALVSIPAAMAAVGWVLGRASAEYEALRGREPTAPRPPSWRSSLGEERAGLRGRPRRLLDTAMTLSASTALVILAIWFFFFAEMRLSPFP
jgi:hypothetical protein